MKFMKNEEIISRYPEAGTITILTRSKVMNKKEKVLDFAVCLLTPAPGIVEEADALSDLGTYFLVENKDDTAILIRVQGDSIEEYDVTGKCAGKSFVYEGSRFRRNRKIFG